MNKLKRSMAFMLAVLMAGAAVSCAKSDDDDEDNDSKEAHPAVVSKELKREASTETVPQTEAVTEEAVPDETEIPDDFPDPYGYPAMISELPDGADGELRWMSNYDLNPSSPSEKSVELTLFNDKGGTIVYDPVLYEQQYDKLAAAIISQSDVPDIVPFLNLSFPCMAIKGLYQPIDSIVDFNSPLWSDVSAEADMFSLRGEHYVAPIEFTPMSVMMYDLDFIYDNGYDDPYELYLNDEWDWDIFYDLCNDAVASGLVKYGLNGYYAEPFIQQTGKTLVSYDPQTSTFSSNLNDPDIERAHNYLYEFANQGLIDDTWIGSCSDALSNGDVLFYSMGIWAITYPLDPNEGENYRIVPFPKDPKNNGKFSSCNITAYMWVTGSQKSDAMRVWLECCRAAQLEPEFAELKKQKFMQNNPQWTDEMYSVYEELCSSEYTQVFDPVFALSVDFSDKIAIDSPAFKLYSNTSMPYEDGVLHTWNELKGNYSDELDSILADLNTAAKSY